MPISPLNSHLYSVFVLFYLVVLFVLFCTISLCLLFILIFEVFFSFHSLFSIVFSILYFILTHEMKQAKTLVISGNFQLPLHLTFKKPEKISPFKTLVSHVILIHVCIMNKKSKIIPTGRKEVLWKNINVKLG